MRDGDWTAFRQKLTEHDEKLKRRVKSVASADYSGATLSDFDKRIVVVIDGVEYEVVARVKG